MKQSTLLRSTLLTLMIMLAVALPQAVFAESPSTGKRVITDMLGKKVEISDPLTRVALFGGPTGQIAYILGARDQLCAVSKALKASEMLNRFDPTIKDLPAPRGASGTISIEDLMLSEAQLVIAGDLDASIVEKRTRIPVAYLESDMRRGIDLLKDEIRFYGNVFRKEARAEKYVLYLENTVALIQSRTRDIPREQRKVVYNGYSPNRLVTLGGDSFMTERIEMAGCRNAAEAIMTGGKKEGLHVGLVEVSMEQVLFWNPDIMVIDICEPERLFQEAKWKTVKAVQNRKVYKEPVGIFIWNRPTAESAVLHPLWLAKLAYPDRFKDIDLREEVKKFYREMMSFNLTDGEADALIKADFDVKFGPLQRKGSN
ncbi:MAG: ABC transporter substrate-binding protein [Syntrophobacteraceae bacterium]|nr:ABC transporter substrate-binding protein [Syntrophobacteraceae bacterium]